MSYLLLKSFFSFSKRLSREKSIKLGEYFGMFMWKAGYRKSVVMKNLDIAFPEKDKVWKEKIGEESLKNIGRTLFEFPKIPDYVKSGKIDDIFVFEKGEKILREKGGKIIVTAHIGNWEIGGAAISSKFGNFSSLAYRIKNEKVNRLITQIRESSGIKIIYHDQPLKYVLKALSSGGVVAFLVDQNALRHRGVFVDFFGFPASTVFFPAKLALKYKYPLIFAYQYYDRENKIYRAVIKDITPKDDDLRSIVQTYTKEIEEAVKKHPDQYFWVHKRWKTRPEGEPEDLY